MTEPRRLLDDPSELTDEERRLLAAGAAVVPPSDLGAEVWAGLAGKLPLAGAGGGAQGTSGPAPGALGANGAAHSAGLSAFLIKAVLTVVALGALVLTGRALLRGDVATSSRPKPAPSAPLPEREVQAPLASVVVDTPAASTPPSAPSALPSHALGPLHSSKVLPPRAPLALPSASTSDASEESRVVAAARDALRSGNSAAALALLGQAQQRFGVGVLGQEREALSIEALAKSGQGAAARARGEAFLKNYARSPYAARIRSLIGSN